jgi:four helix bundle protein
MRGARHFRELIVWQLADELRRETLALTERPDFARDFKLREQAEDAIHSTCRNIAEGFGCDTHREFARFLVIARRSLNELQDAHQGAIEKRHVTGAELRPSRQLLTRLYPALSRFIAYLDRTPNQRNRPNARCDHMPDRTNPMRDRSGPNPNRTDQRPARTDGTANRTDPRLDRTDQRPARTDRTANRTDPRLDRTDPKPDRT